MRYHLMRQDDNGNAFFVQCFCDKSVAQMEANRMERLGHKQTYWVDSATNCEHVSETR